jgi:hypothetical protein
VARGAVARISFAVAAAIAFAAVGCGATPAEDPSPNADTAKAEATSTPSPEYEEIFFPEVRQEGGLDAVPTALGGGEMTLDDAGCLRMLPGKELEGGWVPVWPPYFEVETSGERVRVVDGRNCRTVAEVGRGVVMGGGDISEEALRENGILEEKTQRELFERCPPGYSYWIVGEGVRVTQRH